MVKFHTVLPLISSVLAGDGCKESSSCVCYNEMNINECYSRDSPWGGTSQRPIKSLPDAPTKINPTFTLFTKNSKKGTVLDTSRTVPSVFDKNKKTIFMVHGFLSDGTSEKSWVTKMKDSYLNWDYDLNLITTDWENGAKVGTFDLDYPKAAQNTRVVGDLMGSTMNWLGQSKSKIHCIGHSLGAHICGYAGTYAKGIGRISGLDPAGPYFEGTSSQISLDKSDASFVDNIHTDGPPLYALGFGTYQSMGHADYYPNGGDDQPGCSTLNVGCSHGRACDLYISSIEEANSRDECVLTGFPCSSWDKFENGECSSCGKNGCGQMGYNADNNKSSQSYYLETSSKSPYCV